jgi:cytochrome c oxidase assembly factor CtaG/putative copper export protein
VTQTRVPFGLLTAAFLAVAVAALMSSLVITDGGYVPSLPGIPDPGPLVGWGTPILRLLTTLASIATVGWLLAAALVDPSGRNGVLSPLGRRDVLRAAWSAGIWGILALAQLVFTLALVLGLPLQQTVTPEVISTYANELPITRALLVTALVAIVIIIGSVVTSTTGMAIVWLFAALAAAALPSLAGHSSSLGDHAMALTAGTAHAVAAALWIGGVLALGVHAVRGSTGFEESVHRFAPIALVAFVFLGVSGFANGYTRLENVGQLITTGYGQILISKAILLGALAALAWVLRTRIAAGTGSIRSVFARIAGLELSVMAIAVALGVTLASSPYPRIELQLPSYGETLLGFPYPDAPTMGNVAFGFQLEPFFLAGSLIAAALYCVGYARLIRRGDAWPVGRLISWLLGIGLVIWCTNAGISVYAQVSVGLHMLQHMTLTMLAPVMLVLGAPATLALRALRPSRTHQRGPREWLVWFLHSPINRVLTNPFFVFFIYVVGLYGLYFTPAFGWLMGSHVGHVVMQLHFILSGYLFYWVLIGIDPRPRPMPYWSRMLMLLLALGVHGFFAVALMMGTQPLAVEWYGLVRPEWVTDPLQDTLFGGQVAWGISEIPTVIVLIVIAVQWSRSDDREARRTDRQADRDGDAELRAYNDRLAALADRSGSHSG